MIDQHLLYFYRIDILTARDDQVLLPINETDEAHLVPDRQVANGQVGPAERLRRFFGQVPVTIELIGRA